MIQSSHFPQQAAALKGSQREKQQKLQANSCFSYAEKVTSNNSAAMHCSELILKGSLMNFAGNII